MTIVAYWDVNQQQNKHRDLAYASAQSDEVPLKEHCILRKLGSVHKDCSDIVSFGPKWHFVGI